MNFTDAKKKGASGIERMQIGGISNEKKLSIFKDTEWTTDLSGSTSKLLHGPTSSPVSVCEKMSGEEFLFFTTLASNTTGCEH